MFLIQILSVYQEIYNKINKLLKVKRIKYKYNKPQNKI